jgi:cytochrome bd-type quinol oxidase subunit 2
MRGNYIKKPVSGLFWARPGNWQKNDVQSAGMGIAAIGLVLIVLVIGLWLAL